MGLLHSVFSGLLQRYDFIPDRVFHVPSSFITRIPRQDNQYLLKSLRHRPYLCIGFNFSSLHISK